MARHSDVLSPYPPTPEPLGTAGGFWHIANRYPAHRIFRRYVAACLTKAYHPFMVLVGGSRDRSGPLAPIRAKDQKGKRRDIGADEVKAGEPEYLEETLPDGNKRYQIKARTMEEARTLLGRVKAQYPDL